jgi:hypothetical protein
MSHIPFTTKGYTIIVLEGDMLFAIARGTMTFFKKKEKEKWVGNIFIGQHALIFFFWVRPKQLFFVCNGF